MAGMRLCNGCRQWYESKRVQCPCCDYVRTFRAAVTPYGFYGGSPWAGAFKHDQIDFSNKSMGDSMEEMQKECGVN